MRIKIVYGVGLSFLSLIYADPLFSTTTNLNRAALQTNLTNSVTPIFKNRKTKATEVKEDDLQMTVRLAWDISVSASVVGYNIYWGKASNTYTDVATIRASPAATSVEYTVMKLDELTTYYFAVTAYDAHSLESDFSNEVMFTTAKLLSKNHSINPLSQRSILVAAEK